MFIQNKEKHHNTTLFLNNKILKPSKIYSDIIMIIALAFVLSSCSQSIQSHNLETNKQTSTSLQMSLPNKVLTSTSLNTLNTPLSREACSTLGNNILLLGGLNNLDQSTTEIFSFNPTNKTINLVGNLLFPTHDAAASNIGSNLYVFGGGSYSVYSTVQSFSLSLGKTELATNMPEPRADLTAIKLGQETYIIGGYNGNQLDNSILETTNGISFNTVGTLLVPVRYAAIASINNTIFIFGGIGISGSAVDVIQSFNTVTKTLKIVGYLPTTLSGAYAQTIGNTIYLTGGVTSKEANLTVWAFNGISLKAVGSLDIPSAYGCSASISNKIYIFGGENVKGFQSNAVQIVTPIFNN